MLEKQRQIESIIWQVVIILIVFACVGGMISISNSLDRIFNSLENTSTMTTEMIDDLAEIKVMLNTSIDTLDKIDETLEKIEEAFGE